MIIRRSKKFTVQRQRAFWAKVDKSSEHWLWTGHVGQNGYGQFWDGEKVVGAHVYAWKVMHGPIPDGQEVRHRCGYRHCIRCLTIGTRAENVADMVRDKTCYYQQHPEKILRGDAHGKTKIPDSLVPVLRARHDQGETLRALAGELGVWPTAISYAIRHRGGDAK